MWIYMLCGSEIVTNKSSFKYSSFVFTVLHALPLFYLTQSFMCIYLYMCVYTHSHLPWWFPFSKVPFPGNRREKVTHVFKVCLSIAHLISSTLKEIEKQRMVEVWRHLRRFLCPTAPAQAGSSRAHFPGLVHMAFGYLQGWRSPSSTLPALSAFLDRRLSVASCPNPFLESCFLASWPPACPAVWRIFFILPQVQDCARSLVEVEVPISPCLQVVDLPLDGSMALWCLSCSTLFSVIKLAEGTPCPIIQTINKNITGKLWKKNFTDKSFSLRRKLQYPN